MGFLSDKTVAPILSVVLPVFNAEAHLEVAIKSVLQQSFRDFEVIVIDDGSTDRTRAILNGVQDHRMRVLRHPQNAGLISSLNEGIDAAKGRYIARMDADDICEPARFQQQIDFLDRNSHVGVLGTSIKLIDHQSHVKATILMPSAKADVEWAMPLVCPIVHPSVVMRTEVIRKAGGYPKKALHVEDYQLWMQLSHRVSITNLNAPLLCLRKHGASVTHAQKNKHLHSAAAVSKIELDRRLSSDLSLEVVRCIRSWGQTDQQFALDAVRVLSRAFEWLRLSHPSVVLKACRRDAAMRIGYLARYVPTLQRSGVLREAFKIEPFVVLALAQKLACRLVRGKPRQLIG